MISYEVELPIQDGDTVTWDIREFKSVEDFAQQIRKQRPDGTGKCSVTGRPGFCGTENWTESLDLLETGWEEGRNRIEEIIMRFDDALPVEHEPETVPVNDVAGGQVDMGAYLEGAPDCMIRYEDTDGGPVERKNGKDVSLWVNVTSASATKREHMINRGAAAGALALLLRRKGYRTSITAIAVQQESSTPGRRWMPRIPVKKPGDHVSTENLAYVLAHPSMLRRSIFKLMELEENEVWKKQTFGAYGYPKNISPEHRKECDIYIPALRYSDNAFRSKRSTQRWVLDMLDDLNVDVDERKVETATL